MYRVPSHLALLTLAAGIGTPDASAGNRTLSQLTLSPSALLCLALQRSHALYHLATAKKLTTSIFCEAHSTPSRVAVSSQAEPVDAHLEDVVVQLFPVQGLSHKHFPNGVVTGDNLKGPSDVTRSQGEDHLWKERTQGREVIGRIHGAALPPCLLGLYSPGVQEERDNAKEPRSGSPRLYAPGKSPVLGMSAEQPGSLNLTISPFPLADMKPAGSDGP